MKYEDFHDLRDGDGEGEHKGVESHNVPATTMATTMVTKPATFHVHQVLCCPALAFEALHESLHLICVSSTSRRRCVSLAGSIPNLGEDKRQRGRGREREREREKEREKETEREGEREREGARGRE